MSVKTEERTKDRLEQLQAAIKLETGRKVTQEELLDRLVAREYETTADLIAVYRDEWEGISDEDIERWLSGTGTWGGDDERGHGALLYGQEMAAAELDEDEDS